MTDKSEAETQKELIAAMAKAILRQQEAEKKNDGPTEADREMEHELRKLNPRHQQATVDALTAEVQAKEQEIARLGQYRHGHLPECAGMDFEQMRCGCGYLDGTAYRELVDELATLKARTCETCAWRSSVEGSRRLCTNPAVEHVYGAGEWMPLTVNGQPFGCTAHTPEV